MAIVVCADISGTLIATILLSTLLLLIAVVVVAYIIHRKLKQRAGKQREGYFQWCSGKFGAGGTLDDGGTEGPERGAEARSAGAPRGWSLGRGAVAPPQYGGLGAMPPEKFSKN